MRQKYELGTKLSYFRQKNEKVSLNFTFEAPTFSRHMTYNYGQNIWEEL